MKTSELFEVSFKVVDYMKNQLTYNQYLERGIELMDIAQVRNIDNYMSHEFKYRAKAISNYRQWLKEID